MLRRVALLAVLVAIAGLTTVALSVPAEAAVTTSTITLPADGSQYIQTDADPQPNYPIQGTTDGTTGDAVDIRCYDGPGLWETIKQNVAVDNTGHFSTVSGADAGYGTCVLRAVPSGYSATGDVSAFIGAEITVQQNVTKKIASGPNAGKVYDYGVWYQGAHAFDDYNSAFTYGVGGTRLSYDHGASSNFLWEGVAALRDNDGTRSFLRIDGRNAYGPGSAQAVLPDSQNFPEMTHTVTFNGTTGATIHEIDPVVVCPTGTPFPPTSVSCPKFTSAGVRLERTIVADDGGRQVHIADVWRSTDGKAHTISAHYDQFIDGWDYVLDSPTEVGVKMPWLSTSFKTFTGDTVYPGPASGPGSIFVRDNIARPDGDTDFVRGALSFDIAPLKVERKLGSEFVLRNEGISVPAGGKRIVREAFVTGTTQSVINAKAAANEKAINPYRADGLIKKTAAAAYLGNNVYNTTATNQTTTANRHRGTTAVFDIKVQNDGTAPDSVKLKGPGGTQAFAVHYYAGLTGSTDITTAVTNGTYALKNLAPGAVRIIRLVITVRSGATIGALRSWLVVASSTHDANRKDAVKARVQVVSR